MEQQKFEIAGKIEGGDAPNKKQTLYGRYFLFVFVLIIVGGVWYFPFLQDEFPALKKITMGNHSAITAADTTLLNENYALKAKIDSLEEVNQGLLNTLPPAETIQQAPMQGVYYEVQIGIFKHFNSDKYAEQLTGLYAEKINADEAKITLGRFTNQNAARDFLKDIKEMGFKDAWIVAKENGERVAITNKAAK